MRRQRWEPVDVISVKNTSIDWFNRHYLSRGIPAIIEDLHTDWPAYKLWTKEYWATEPGIADVPMHYVDMSNVTGHPSANKEQLTGTVAEFIRRLDAGEKVQLFAAASAWTDFISYNPKLLSHVRLHGRTPCTTHTLHLPYTFPRRTAGPVHRVFHSCGCRRRRRDSSARRG